MGRRPYSTKALPAFEAIQQRPGITGADLMRLLGHQTKQADAVLTACENMGYWLSEDEYGRLYPWTIEDSERY